MTEPLVLTTDKGDKIRILTPFEYDTFVANIDKDYLRTLFNLCFWTGMRYIEVQRLYEHQDWILQMRRAIHLPRDAQLKAKRVAPERNVPIPAQLQGELAYFFKNQKPPVLKVWGENLKRWAKKAGIEPIGITPKMTRATLESWMYAAGISPNDICLRQGHDKLTSLNHYQTLSALFLESERTEIKKRLAGWV